MFKFAPEPAPLDWPYFNTRPAADEPELSVIAALILILPAAFSVRAVAADQFIGAVTAMSPFCEPLVPAVSMVTLLVANASVILEAEIIEFELAAVFVPAVALDPLLLIVTLYGSSSQVPMLPRAADVLTIAPVTLRR